MISFIQGKVLSNNGAELTILTSGGVGYRIVATPAMCQKAKVNTEVLVLAYLAVREESMELYGFVDEAERSLFRHLLTVGGIGPKSAIRLLSLDSAKDLESAIARSDMAYLTKISGIGKKIAERIVVELKDKIMSVSGGGNRTAGGKLGEVAEGLKALGYSVAEARDAVKDLSTEDKTSEQLMREALKRLSK